MKQPALNEQLVRRYLLGDLPRRERERLEVGLLTDDRYYKTLTALEDQVEDDLIDEYLDDELTGTERENFEHVFLNTPERAHKLKVVKDLKDRAAVTSPGEAPDPKIVKPDPSYGHWMPAIAIFQNPLFGLSSTAALMLALLCCAWLWMRSNNLEAQLRQARAQPLTDPKLKEQVEQLRQRNDALTAELERSKEELASLKQQETQGVTPPDQTSTPDRPTFATLTLSPSLRSTANKKIPTLTLYRGMTEARLYLNVERVNPSDYPRVRAIVKRQSGAEVWRNDDVKLQQRGNNARAELSIPAEILTGSQYVGTLDGFTSDDQTELLGLYFFRVIHK